MANYDFYDVVPCIRTAVQFHKAELAACLNTISEIHALAGRDELSRSCANAAHIIGNDRIDLEETMERLMYRMHLWLPAFGAACLIQHVSYVDMGLMLFRTLHPHLQE